MAQIARTFDRSLMKSYVFADYLYRVLPKNPRKRVDLDKKVKLGITANRYLLRKFDEKGKPIKDTNDVEGYVRDEEHTDPNVKKYWIDDYNNGYFPFKPYPYKKLYLAVGYNKERDTALVEVDGYRFIPNMIRDNLYAFWMIAFHIGKVLEVHRK